MRISPHTTPRSILSNRIIQLTEIKIVESKSNATKKLEILKIKKNEI